MPLGDLQRLPRRRLVRVRGGPHDPVRGDADGGSPGHDGGDERDPADPSRRRHCREARRGAIANGVAGEAAAVYDINTTANHDLAVVIPVAVVAIGLLLALVLRSLVAPLYLIVSVVLSYLAALGVATIVFIDLGGDSGISFILPFLMFIFLLALGEDYNILVMTRIREEARRLPLREAVVKAIGRTGPTVTSAGIILGGTFAVFAIVGGWRLRRRASCARSASGSPPAS